MALNESFENPNAPAAKMSYEKPSFCYEEVFVATALTCTKITGTTHGSGSKKS